VVSVASPSRPRHSKVALLVVKRGTEEGKTVQVNGQVSLGSDRVNDFALADRSVSARHGLIRLEDGVHVYHDLASLNGSYLVKGRFRERIGAPLKLMHGDVIEVGRTRLVYLEESR
jgi:pSer/pThr/pTyr-binding forkhead associated (FHA) protein